MILPFTSKLNKKPTYFPERIIKGLDNLTDIERIVEDLDKILGYESYPIIKTITPKIHTIREDKKNRWKVGTKIDFYINVRQKNMFRFTPVLPVLSIQKVEIIYLEIYPVLKVDGKLIYNKALGYNSKEMLEFAQNDGFDTIEDFFAYFNKPFIGKLIHWTDKKY